MLNHCETDEGSAFCSILSRKTTLTIVVVGCITLADFGEKCSRVLGVVLELCNDPVYRLEKFFPLVPSLANFGQQAAQLSIVKLDRVALRLDGL